MFDSAIKSLFFHLSIPKAGQEVLPENMWNADAAQINSVRRPTRPTLLSMERLAILNVSLVVW